jgi:hypothetical protein
MFRGFRGLRLPKAELAADTRGSSMRALSVDKGLVRNAVGGDLGASRPGRRQRVLLEAGRVLNPNVALPLTHMEG